jgi:hypothetical protein
MYAPLIIAQFFNLDASEMDSKRNNDSILDLITNEETSSATTIVSVRKSWVLWTDLTAHTDSRTL